MMELNADEVRFIINCIVVIKRDLSNKLIEIRGIDVKQEAFAEIDVLLAKMRAELKDASS